MQRYVLLAPFRRAGSPGEVARNLLRGLSAAGAEVGAIDTLGPDASSAHLDLLDLAPLLDGPVRLRGATAVYHAPLLDLPAAFARQSANGASRRVAHVDWPEERLPGEGFEALQLFDEVWVPAHFQRELFAACGVPRKQVFTIPPGVETAARAVLDRHASPLRPPPELLDEILGRLGLRRPEELIADSRERVLLCAVEGDQDDWRTPLRSFLARHGPEDDVTLCIWLDEHLAQRLQELAADVQAEIDAAGRPNGPGDILLLSAPLEHVPWQKVACRE